MELLHVGDSLVEVHVYSLLKRLWEYVEGGVGVEGVDGLELCFLGCLVMSTVVGELGMWDALVPILKVRLDQCSKE